jgi:hypothetical protein
MIIAAEAALCNALLKDRVDFRALFNGGSTIASVDAHQFERKFKLIPVRAPGSRKRPLFSGSLMTRLN